MARRHYSQHFHLGVCIPEEDQGPYGHNTPKPLGNAVKRSAERVRIHVEYDLADSSSKSNSRLIIKERGIWLFEELKRRVLLIPISKVYPLNPENIEVVTNDDRYKPSTQTCHAPVPKVLKPTYTPQSRSPRSRWTKSTASFPRIGALEVIISWCEPGNITDWNSVVLFSRLNTLAWPNIDDILNNVELILSPSEKRDLWELSAAQKDGYVMKLKSEVLKMKQSMCLELVSKLPIDSAYTVSHDEMRQMSRAMLFLRVLREELSVLQKKKAQLIDEVEVLEHTIQRNAALLEKLRMFEAMNSIAEHKLAPVSDAGIHAMPPMKRIPKRAVEDDWSVDSVQDKDLLSIFLEQGRLSLTEERKRCSLLQDRISLFPRLLKPCGPLPMMERVSEREDEEWSGDSNGTKDVTDVFFEQGHKQLVLLIDEQEAAHNLLLTRAIKVHEERFSATVAKFAKYADVLKSKNFECLAAFKVSKSDSLSFASKLLTRLRFERTKSPESSSPRDTGNLYFLPSSSECCSLEAALRMAIQSSFTLKHITWADFTRQWKLRRSNQELSCCNTNAFAGANEIERALQDSSRKFKRKFIVHVSSLPNTSVNLEFQSAKDFATFIWCLTDDENLQKTLLAENVESSPDTASEELLSAPAVLRRIFFEFANPWDMVQRPTCWSAARWNHDLKNVIALYKQWDVPLNLRDVDMFGRTLLHWAAEKGNVDACKVLIDNNCQPDISSTDSAGQTPMHLASKAGKFGILLDLILMCPQAATIRDFSGRDPLHLFQFASEDPDAQRVLIMLATSSNLNYDLEGSSAVHKCAAHGKALSLSCLKQNLRGFDITARSPEYELKCGPFSMYKKAVRKPTLRCWGPLEMALATGNLSVLDFISQQCMSNYTTDYPDELISALCLCKTIIPNELFRELWGFLKSSNRSGWPKDISKKFVSMLRENNELFTLVGGLSAIAVAVLYGKLEILQDLIEYRVDMYHDKSSPPALWLASLTGNCAAANLLLDQRVSPNFHFETARLALDLDMHTSKVVCSYLTGSYHCPRNWTYSPLGLAVCCGHLDMIHLLLDRGADCSFGVETEDGKPLSALHILVQHAIPLHNKWNSRTAEAWDEVGAKLARCGCCLSVGGDGVDTLTLAIRKRLSTTAVALIQANPSIVNSSGPVMSSDSKIDHSGGVKCPYLHEAAYVGNELVVACLLEHGADSGKLAHVCTSRALQMDSESMDLCLHLPDVKSAHRALHISVQRQKWDAVKAFVYFAWQNFEKAPSSAQYLMYASTLLPRTQINEMLPCTDLLLHCRSILMPMLKHSSGSWLKTLAAECLKSCTSSTRLQVQIPEACCFVLAVCDSWLADRTWSGVEPCPPESMWIQVLVRGATNMASAMLSRCAKLSNQVLDGSLVRAALEADPVGRTGAARLQKRLAKFVLDSQVDSLLSQTSDEPDKTFNRDMKLGVVNLYSQFTPLALAVCCGHLDMIHLLLDRGADCSFGVETEDGKPLSALHILVQHAIPLHNKWNSRTAEAWDEVGAKLARCGCCLSVGGDGVDTLTLTIRNGLLETFLALTKGSQISQQSLFSSSHWAAVIRSRSVIILKHMLSYFPDEFPVELGPLIIGTKFNTNYWITADIIVSICPKLEAGHALVLMAEYAQQDAFCNRWKQLQNLKSHVSVKKLCDWPSSLPLAMHAVKGRDPVILDILLNHGDDVFDDYVWETSTKLTISKRTRTVLRRFHLLKYALEINQEIQALRILEHVKLIASSATQIWFSDDGINELINLACSRGLVNILSALLGSVDSWPAHHESNILLSVLGMCKNVDCVVIILLQVAVPGKSLPTIPWGEKQSEQPGCRVPWREHFVSQLNLEVIADSADVSRLLSSFWGHLIAGFVWNENQCTSTKYLDALEYSFSEILPLSPDDRLAILKMKLFDNPHSDTRTLKHIFDCINQNIILQILGNGNPEILSSFFTFLDTDAVPTDFLIACLWHFLCNGRDESAFLTAAYLKCHHPEWILGFVRDNSFLEYKNPSFSSYFTAAHQMMELALRHQNNITAKLLLFCFHEDFAAEMDRAANYFLFLTAHTLKNFDWMKCWIQCHLPHWEDVQQCISESARSFSGYSTLGVVQKWVQESVLAESCDCCQGLMATAGKSWAILRIPESSQVIVSSQESKSMSEIRLNWKSLEFHKEWAADKNIGLFAIGVDYRAMQYLSEEIRSDRDFVLKAVQLNWRVLEFTGKTVQEDRGLMFFLKAAETYQHSVMCASRDLFMTEQADSALCLAVKYANLSVRDNKSQPSWLCEDPKTNWLEDMCVASELIQDHGSQAMQQCSEKLRGDEEFLLKSVKDDYRVLLHASEHLKGDRDFMLRAINIDWRVIEFAGDALFNDHRFIIESMKISVHILGYVPEPTRSDHDISLHALCHGLHSAPYITKILLRDIFFVMRAIMIDVDIIEQVEEGIVNHPDVQIAVLLQNLAMNRPAFKGLPLHFESISDIQYPLEKNQDIIHCTTARSCSVSTMPPSSQVPPSRFSHNEGNRFYCDEEALWATKLEAPEMLEAREQPLALETAESLWEDESLAMEAIVKDSCAFEFVSDYLMSCRDFVLKAVAVYGCGLKYACHALKDDRDVVLAAIQQDWRALQYASKQLQGERDIVTAAVTKDWVSWRALAQASDEMRADKDIVTLAIARDCRALGLASDELKKDRGFVLDAVRVNGRSLMYACKELKEDYDFLVEVASIDGRAIQFAGNTLQLDKTILLKAWEKSNYDTETQRKAFLGNGGNDTAWRAEIATTLTQRLRNSALNELRGSIWQMATARHWSCRRDAAKLIGMLAPRGEEIAVQLLLSEYLLFSGDSAVRLASIQALISVATLQDKIVLDSLGQQANTDNSPQVIAAANKAISFLSAYQPDLSVIAEVLLTSGEIHALAEAYSWPPTSPSHAGDLMSLLLGRLSAGDDEGISNRLTAWRFLVLVCDSLSPTVLYDGLLQALDSRCAAVRRAGCVLLQRAAVVNLSSAIEILIRRCSSDPDCRVRAMSLRTLALLGPEATHAVAIVLSSCCSDTCWRVRLAAAGAAWDPVSQSMQLEATQLEQLLNDPHCSVAAAALALYQRAAVLPFDKTESLADAEERCAAALELGKRVARRDTPMFSRQMLNCSWKGASNDDLDTEQDLAAVVCADTCCCKEPVCLGSSSQNYAAWLTTYAAAYSKRDTVHLD